MCPLLAGVYRPKDANLQRCFLNPSPGESRCLNGLPYFASDDTRAAGSPDVYGALLPTQVCMLPAAPGPAPDPDLNWLVTGFQETHTCPQSPSSAFWVFGELLQRHLPSHCSLPPGPSGHCRHTSFYCAWQTLHFFF